VGLTGAAHAAVTLQQRSVLVERRFNSCTGEAIDFTGWVHLVRMQGEDGGLELHLNTHLTGVGDRGNGYVVNLGQVLRVGESTFSVSFRERLISQGAETNMLLVITHTVPGEFDISLECQG
jgi:hypothetical protein